MSGTNDEYGDKEATKRMEDALRRALNTPHKPNQAFVGKKANPESGESQKGKRAKAAAPGRAKKKATK